MIERLQSVLIRDLNFSESDANLLASLVTRYARQGPSLTLGGVGVIPTLDVEDRHVLETAWAGGADVLVTANLTDFVRPTDEPIVEGRLYQSWRGGVPMMLAHPFEAARWLRSGKWLDE